MYKHILIATDGSELADKGVEHGLALASALGSKVSVLTVSAPLSSEAIQAALAGGIEDPVGRYDQQISTAALTFTRSAPRCTNYSRTSRPPRPSSAFCARTPSSPFAR